MWSYYGSKGKIAQYYAKPQFDKIIEPFAGAAKYSLLHWEKEVILVDKYNIVTGLWNYLKQASESDIIGLPELGIGENVDDFNLTQEEKWLVGFVIKGGINSPRKTYSGVGGFGKNQKNQYKKIASQLFKIRHWQIIEGSYDQLENQNATWFIDPPYQFGGEYYNHSNKKIDFIELATWCKERNGQVIVCENTKADWLPFEALKEMQGSIYKTTEAVWYNNQSNYIPKQFQLFEPVRLTA